MCVCVCMLVYGPCIINHIEGDVMEMNFRRTEFFLMSFDTELWYNYNKMNEKIPTTIIMIFFHLTIIIEPRSFNRFTRYIIYQFESSQRKKNNISNSSDSGSNNNKNKNERNFLFHSLKRYSIIFIKS